MNTERLTVRIHSDLRRNVAKRAKADGQDQSEVVRRALEQYLVPPVSAHDALMKAGLIGIVKNGPRDLSSNRKHMEGFGTGK